MIGVDDDDDDDDDDSARCLSVILTGPRATVHHTYYDVLVVNFVYTHTRLVALFRDYTGEPVPER